MVRPTYQFPAVSTLHPQCVRRPWSMFRRSGWSSTTRIRVLNIGVPSPIQSSDERVKDSSLRDARPIRRRETGLVSVTAAHAWFKRMTSSWIAPQCKHRDAWIPVRDPSRGSSRWSRATSPSQRGEVIVETPHTLADGLGRNGCPPGPGSRIEPGPALA